MQCACCLCCIAVFSVYFFNQPIRTQSYVDHYDELRKFVAAHLHCAGGQFIVYQVKLQQCNALCITHKLLT